MPHPTGAAPDPRPRWAAAIALVAGLALLALSGCSGADPDDGEAPDPPGSVPADPPEPDLAAPAEPDDAADAPETDPAADPPGADDPPVDPPPPDPRWSAHDEPIRAVWVHLFDDSLTTTAGIARMVAELEAAEATAVIAQVARRHDAFYASQVLPATAEPALEPGLDVITELTRAAHAAGIEVHAWISVAPTWHDRYQDLPAPDGWLATTHGHLAPEADRWVTRDLDGTWGTYLDPALPEVHDHLAAVVTELVERTPVDGVHLDYVRYDGPRTGYHPAALARWQAHSGSTSVPAPDDPAWSAWRRERATELVATARTALDAAAARTGRQLTLSAAVIAWGPGPTEAGGFAATRTATEALQDWPRWAREGLVDAVLPMTYFRAHDTDQARWFDDWLGFHTEVAASGPARVVPGIGAWLNQPEAVLDQVAAATGATGGAAVYSYQQPSADPADARASTDATGPTDRPPRPLWSQLAATGWDQADPGA